MSSRGANFGKTAGCPRNLCVCSGCEGLYSIGTDGVGFRDCGKHHRRVVVEVEFRALGTIVA